MLVFYLPLSPLTTDTVYWWEGSLIASFAIEYVKRILDQGGDCTTHCLMNWVLTGFGQETKLTLLSVQCTSYQSIYPSHLYLRCAVAQAVSRRLHIAAIRVWARVRSCGICGRVSDSGAGFLRVLRFLLPMIPSTDPHQSSSIIIRGWYNRPVVAPVLGDSVPLHHKGN
jgi:hypothetical protein